MLRLLPCLCLYLATAYLLSACQDSPNNPYPQTENGENIIYDFFRERPKHLDPVQAYSVDEADVLYQIYEPLYHYHYLARPFKLEPLIATALPKISYLNAKGQRLSDKAKTQDIAKTVYEIPLRKGVQFAPHPAFAKTPAGDYLYHQLSAAELRGKYRPTDFAESASRELTAADYVWQLKRLARPGLHSPAFETMRQIEGMDELKAQLDADRKSGKIDAKAWIDLQAYPLSGVTTPDPYTLRITLKGKYPQFLYWLAQTFVSPMAWEADRFFSQPGMAQNNLTLDNWTVGTGPYQQSVYDPQREIRLIKNPLWRGDTYPCEGSEADRVAGLLDDCGKPMPFADVISLRKEAEAIPFWSKFQQGYYDQFKSGRVALASFDSALQMPGNGSLDLSDKLSAQGVKLQTEGDTGVYYYAFNMQDPVVGGQDEKSRQRAQKLRQALSIAVNIEEYLSIFLNGLGNPAQNPVPPTIAPRSQDCVGRNPVVYDCQNNKAVRKPLAEAEKLLAEAGYPKGRDAKTGEPLILYFDGVSSSRTTSQLDWLTNQFRRLGIQLVPRITDYNRFQEKTRSGNFQILLWGWNADYPDPENFLFLLYGPHGKAKHGGENAANYHNAEYDRLYEQYKTLDLQDPQRDVLLKRMVSIVQIDAPWMFGWHDESFYLNHSWFHNFKPGKMIQDIRKYQRVDVAERQQARQAWNRPVWWPLALILISITLIIGSVWRHLRRQSQACPTRSA